MPLGTQIKRNGRVRKIRWGAFHAAAMTLGAALDSDEGVFAEKYREGAPDEWAEMQQSDPLPLGPGDVWNLVDYGVIAATPLNDGDYTMKKTRTFIDLTDNEVFELREGDVLSVWRS